MTNHRASCVSSLARTAASVAASLVLAACGASLGGDYDDVYVSQVHYERHPIEVGKGTVKMRVPTASPVLAPSQEENVLRFAQQASGNNAGPVVVSRPTGSVHSAAVADRIAHLLAGEGIHPASIVYTTYNGGRGAPVVVSFSRYFATSPECGDWSQALNVTGLNEPHPNFGCAQQHNIAALVANPQDLAVPRASTPPDAMRRSQVFTDYRTPKSTATPIDDRQTVTVSDVAE